MIAFARDLIGKLTSHRFIRFAVVGGISSGIYAVVVAFILLTNLAVPAVASVIGYCAAIPFNFFAQKLYTFKSSRRAREEIWRFTLLQIANIGVSTVCLHLTVAVFGWPYYVGIACVIAVIPVATYFLMKIFVFTAPKTSIE